MNFFFCLHFGVRCDLRCDSSKRRHFRPQRYEKFMKLQKNLSLHL